METKTLQYHELASLVNALARDAEVIAPTGEIGYGEITSGDQMTLGPVTPRKSLREFFFPQREVLLAYRLGTGLEPEVFSPPAIEMPRVILTRPCDARSLPILDRLFGWDAVDRFYTERREATTIISIACDQPINTCFCTSVGGSPTDTRGSDLLLSRIGEVYHVQVLTERGKKLVERYETFFISSSAKLDEQQAAAAAAWRSQIRRSVDIKQLQEALKFDDSIWETATQECVDCGICTFLCPTCHCFDIRDEGSAAAGNRLRLWDSCAFSEYTQMPVHQPRPQHYRRYRQRIMHKFNYYPARFQETLCVGCGRCIRQCPVGVDITAVLQKVTA